MKQPQQHPNRDTFDLDRLRRRLPAGTMRARLRLRLRLPAGTMRIRLRLRLPAGATRIRLRRRLPAGAMRTSVRVRTLAAALAVVAAFAAAGPASAAAFAAGADAQRDLSPGLDAPLTAISQVASTRISEAAGSLSNAAILATASLESVATKAGETGRNVAMSLIGLALAIAAVVLAFRRDFKEAVAVFAVGLVCVLMATSAGETLLQDTVNALVGS